MHQSVRDGPQGSYHYVVGLLLWSQADAASYITDLVQVAAAQASLQAAEATTSTSTGASSWLAALKAKPPVWSITSGRLCAWNAFTQADVCIDFRIPGGTVAFTTRDGMRYTLAIKAATVALGRDVDVHGCLVHLLWFSADVSENEWQQLAVSCGLRALVPATDSQPGLR